MVSIARALLWLLVKSTSVSSYGHSVRELWCQLITSGQRSDTMVQLTIKEVPAPTANSVAWMHSGDLVLWFDSDIFGH